MTATVITAAIVSTCGLCNRQIAIGQRIAKDRKTGKFAHADCIWPSKANAPSGTPMVAHRESPKDGAVAPSPSPPSNHFPGGEEVAVIVERRVIQAKEIVLRQAPDAKDYVDYYNLITEIIKQLQSQEWLELEKHKVR